MTKFILYTRTSTADQSNGIVAQRNSANRFLKDDDIIIKEYTEKESGRKTDRIELAQAINDCLKNGYTLLIARLDRLSRNAKFTLELMESKVDFVCADMPNANNLTIGIMALLAQSEAERISSNTKKALAVLKSKGVKLGTNNLTIEGGLKGGRIRKEQAQRVNHQATKIILRLRKEGMTFKAIADELNTDGYTTSNGYNFMEQTVSRLYKRTIKKVA